VLTVHIPKAALPQPKRIQIGVQGKQKEQAGVGTGTSNQRASSTRSNREHEEVAQTR
jgi:hypothetical protein